MTTTMYEKEVPQFILNFHFKTFYVLHVYLQLYNSLVHSSIFVSVPQYKMDYLQSCHSFSC